MSAVTNESDLRRGGHRARWIAAAVAVPLLAITVVLATRPPAATRSASSRLVGQHAPAIAGTTIDGGRVDASDYRDRWLLVNFFATWCVPCRKEHPDLIAFRERHAAIGDAEVIGIVYGDTAGAVRSFRRENGGAWPMLLDRGGRIAVDLGVSGVPESFLISPDGYIVSKLVGGIHDDQLETLLTHAKRQFR